MLAAAIQKQALLESEKVIVPAGALEALTRALHEHECAMWDETMNEQKAWDDLPPGAKEASIENAAWLFGRLAIAGFVVLARKDLRKLADSVSR